MSTTEAVIGLVLPDPGTPGVAGSGDPVDGSILNANWTKVGKYAGSKTGQNAVASFNNVTTENTVASGLILPTAVAGTAFRFSVWGNYQNQASATTLTLRWYLGSALCHSLAISTPALAFSGQTWHFDWDAVCQTAGAAGTWESKLVGGYTTSNTKNMYYDINTSAVAQTITLPNNFLKVTAQWAVANASNVVTGRSSVSYWTKAV